MNFLIILKREYIMNSNKYPWLFCNNLTLQLFFSLDFLHTKETNSHLLTWSWLVKCFLTDIFKGYQELNCESVLKQLTFVPCILFTILSYQYMVWFLDVFSNHSITLHHLCKYYNTYMYNVYLWYSAVCKFNINTSIQNETYNIAMQLQIQFQYCHWCLIHKSHGLPFTASSYYRKKSNL
jgi:hypothetical protein